MNSNKIVFITGSIGLIGFEATEFFLKKGFCVIGIDNDIRTKLFHSKTQYKKKLEYLTINYPLQYTHYKKDIREKNFLSQLFHKHSKNIGIILHTAAQPSHDWAQKDPFTDFAINATATLNLLEIYRKYSPQAVFIFTSTNKVYGDLVNQLDLKEFGTRYDLNPKNIYFNGIEERFPIDQSMHSLFGVSKTSADLLVQEYGKYFGLKTGVFRLSVVSGSGQNGALEQGFFSYLIKILKQDKKFTILGYKGKQVRDIIHATDVVNAFDLYYRHPSYGEVYNLGGGRNNSLSILELIDRLYKLTGRKLKTNYIDVARKGDHQWWITNYSKFQTHFPSWKINYSVDKIIMDIYKDGYDL